MKTALAHIIVFLVALVLAIALAVFALWGLILLEAFIIFTAAGVLLLVERTRDSLTKIDRDVDEILKGHARGR